MWCICTCIFTDDCTCTVHVQYMWDHVHVLMGYQKYNLCYTCGYIIYICHLHITITDLDEESITSPIVYKTVQEKTCLGILSWQLKHLPVILKMMSSELSVYVIIDQVVCIYQSLVRLIRHRIESLISKRLVI